MWIHEADADAAPYAMVILDGAEPVVVAPDVEEARVVAGRGALDLSGQDDWVLQADNSDLLPRLPDAAFRLIYVDPPFNSGRGRRRGAATEPALRHDRQQ